MDIELFLQAVSTVGFPIVACAFMWVQNDKMQKTLSELTSTLTLMSERIKDVEEELKKGEQ